MAQPPELRGDLVRLVTSPEFMVEFTLRLLGLQGCADTVVGDAMIRCVRKLLGKLLSQGWVPLGARRPCPGGAGATGASLVPVLVVLPRARLGRRTTGRLAGMPHNAQLCLHACPVVHLPAHVRSGISGGQKRRLTCGELLVGGRELLLLDEISTGELLSCFLNRNVIWWIW